MAGGQWELSDSDSLVGIAVEVLPILENPRGIAEKSINALASRLLRCGQ